MPATSKHRPLEDALVAAFVDDLRRRTADFSEYFFGRHRRIARHFLIWIDLAGVELKKVDATIVHRFLRHDCRCGASCAPVRIQRWRKRRRSAELMRFVRFLERSGHVETPGELEDNLRLLDPSSAGCATAATRLGRSTRTVRMHRSDRLAAPVAHPPWGETRTLTWFPIPDFESQTTGAGRIAGAWGETRTLTWFPIPDFESGASTGFATQAGSGDGGSGPRGRGHCASIEALVKLATAVCWPNTACSLGSEAECGPIPNRAGVARAVDGRVLYRRRLRSGGRRTL